jgi:nicotinamidase-related amidase
MKKCLLVVGMISTMLFPVFAEYTLKADDQKAIDAVIQKIKAKSIRTQEKAIKTLKDAQTKTNLTEQKRAIITAVEK